MADHFRIAGVIDIDLNSLSNSLNEAHDKVQAGVDSMEGIMSKVGSVLKWGMVAIGGALVGAVKSTDDMTKALNSLQVKTGETNDTMGEYKDIMLEIYGNNFGEDFDDVADSIAQVRTNLWLSGDELQKVTEYAIGFRDAFDVEVNESTRSAKALMDNFGISAEQSFNLLAQGYQNGLNYSDELIDSINEYSVQFAKLGLNAEDMFSIFESGTEAGAFNLDKIGDAVKELSIRVIDGSDTTIEGFELIGLNADEMAQKFASGGDSAKEAFNQVIEGLKKCDDPVKQNLAGTDLLGTMWEDLGADVVTSLSTANDYFDMTADSMEQLNQIQYNSFGEAMAGIGRQIQSGILIPIGEKVLPICNEFANWLQSEGVPKLKAFVDTINFSAIADVTGKALKGILETVGFLADHMNILLPILSGVLGAFLAFKVVTGVLKAIELAQAAVNLVMAANPISLVVLAIGSLIAIGVALWQNWDTIKEKAQALWGTITEKWESIKNATSEKWNSIKDTMSSAVEGAKNLVKEKLNNIKSAYEENGGGIKGVVAGAMQGVKEYYSTGYNAINKLTGGKLGELKDKFTNTMENVKDTVRKAIDKVKDFFNFNWKLPSIKLPHFSVSGSANPIRWLSEGVPKINVDWYAKGAIFTKPTILSNGIGVGDKSNGNGSNAEAILPLDKLKDYIKEELKVNVSLVVDGKEFVREVVAPHQREIDSYNLGRW